MSFHGITEITISVCSETFWKSLGFHHWLKVVRLQEVENETVKLRGLICRSNLHGKLCRESEICFDQPGTKIWILFPEASLNPLKRNQDVWSSEIYADDDDGDDDGGGDKPKF